LFLSYSLFTTAVVLLLQTIRRITYYFVPFKSIKHKFIVQPYQRILYCIIMQNNIITSDSGETRPSIRRCCWFQLNCTTTRSSISIYCEFSGLTTRQYCSMPNIAVMMCGAGDAIETQSPPSVSMPNIHVSFSAITEATGFECIPVQASAEVKTGLIKTGDVKISLDSIAFSSEGLRWLNLSAVYVMETHRKISPSVIVLLCVTWAYNP
jgi:hypothetical protein